MGGRPACRNGKQAAPPVRKRGPRTTRVRWLAIHGAGRVNSDQGERERIDARRASLSEWQGHPLPRDGDIANAAAGATIAGGEVVTSTSGVPRPLRAKVVPALLKHRDV